MRADRREGCCASETIGAHSVRRLCHEESAKALLVDLGDSAMDIVQLREAGERIGILNAILPPRHR